MVKAENAKQKKPCTKCMEARRRAKEKIEKMKAILKAKGF